MRTQKESSGYESQKKSPLEKEGWKGDFSEEMHASEGWWQEKDLKRKEEESREIEAADR